MVRALALLLLLSRKECATIFPLKSPYLKYMPYKSIEKRNEYWTSKRKDPIWRCKKAEYMKQYLIKWRLENPELSKQKQLNFIKSHPDYFKKWRKTPKGVLSEKLKSQRRWARERNAPGRHTMQEWIQIKTMNAYLCNNCGNMEPFIQLTVDHIIPLTKSGSDNIENIQPLCQRCNSKKGNRLLKVY